MKFSANDLIGARSSHDAGAQSVFMRKPFDVDQVLNVAEQLLKLPLVQVFSKIE